MSKSRYLAVKIDVVASRRSGDRSALQDRLFATARDVNEEFEKEIVSRFVVTHGDEVQGMLHLSGHAALLSCVEAWVDGLRPHRLRFGVGAGSLSTPLQPQAIGMDGEAWHLAKESVDGAHRERKHFAILGLQPNSDRSLTALANLLLALRYGWTAKQARAVELAREFPTHAQAAAAMSIAPATFSRHLKAAHWDVYREGREAFALLIEDSIEAR